MPNRSENDHIEYGDDVLHAIMLADLQVSADTVLHLSTDSQRREFFGNVYEPAGGLLSISNVEEREGVESRDISIALKTNNSELQTAALAANLANRDIRIRIAVSDNPNTWTDDDVIDLILGRVGDVSVNATEISATIYTPMTDMTSIHPFARRWSDEHQRKYVDTNDLFFRFTADNSVKEIIL